MAKTKQISSDKWTEYYSNLDSFMQPNEYLLKLLLGNYDGKKFFLGNNGWRDAFSRLDVLDLSCGDGRNIILLEKLRFNVYATEISESICEKVFYNISRQGSRVSRNRIQTGLNNQIPFGDGVFDFLVSWNAIYYLNDENHQFSENLDEVSRVLKKNGYFIGSVPGPKCYSLAGGRGIGANRIKLRPSTNRSWGNGILDETIVYRIKTKKQLFDLLSGYFCEIGISELNWDGFGSAPLHYFMFVARKK